MTRADEFLSDLLYDQSKLAEICAERPLDWVEYAHMNEFHGNSAVLREFAGLPADEPMPFAIEHAIPYDLEEAYDYDVNSGLPVFLAVNENSAGLYRSRGLKTHAIGFTYLYSLELFRQRHSEIGERRGTIVFPDKSTLLMDTDFDRAAFAQKLLGLPDEFQPVVVCIYWKDFVRGTHRPFEEAGLPIVSCGHLRDGLFPYRLHDLCRRFRYSCANDIAGSFTLSILSGCHFFHLPGGELRQEKHGKVEVMEKDPGLDKPRKASCLEASPFPPQDPAAQRLLARELAGVDHLRSRKEIRRFHGDANRMLAEQFPTEGFDPADETNRRKLFSLRPVGIDLDGWCRRHMRIRVPHQTDARAIRLKFSVLTGEIEAKSKIVVSRNGRPFTTVTVEDWKCECTVELSAWKRLRIRDDVITLDAEFDYRVGTEIRRRSLLLESIEPLQTL